MTSYFFLEVSKILTAAAVPELLQLTPNFYEKKSSTDSIHSEFAFPIVDFYFVVFQPLITTFCYM